MNHRGAQFRDSPRDLFPARPLSRKEGNHLLFALLVGGRSENTDAVFQALNCIAQYLGSWIDRCNNLTETPLDVIRPLYLAPFPTGLEEPFQKRALELLRLDLPSPA